MSDTGARPESAVWVDFNGTLVSHRPGSPVWSDKGEVVIGTPVREMVSRVRRHMAKGRRFVIKSAMMSDADPARRSKVEKAIGDWSQQHLGQRLEVTATCRPEFIDQWDDKVRRVTRNEGTFADEQLGGADDGQGTAGNAGRSRGVEGAGKTQDRKRQGGGATVPTTTEGERAKERWGEWVDWKGE